MSVKINLSPGGLNKGPRTGPGTNTDFSNAFKKLINLDSRKVDVSSLPVTYTVPGSRFGGWFMIVFSMVWGGVPTAIFLSEMGQGPIDPEMYMLLIFSAIGLGLLLGGLYTVSRRETIILDSQTVTLDKKSVFGHKLWSEPLSRYKGVRARTEYHSGGKNQSSYTLHIVELYHIDKNKRIKLYESKNPGSFRSVFEDYSRQLRMPALEGEDGQLSKRDAADLDKSVRELVQEGKLKVDFDPRKAPPRGVTAQMKGERLSIVIPPSPMDAGGMFIGFIFVLVFGFIGFFVEEAPWFLGLIAIIFLLFVIGAQLWDRIARPVLEIGRDKVLFYRTAPWGKTTGESIPSDAIESVHIGKRYNNRGRKGVLIVSDNHTLKVAEGLPEPTQQWLRNCVLSIITR